MLSVKFKIEYIDIGISTMYALKILLVILYLYCTSVVSLSALMKAVLRLEAMLWYRGSRDVISARAEVMFLIM